MGDITKQHGRVRHRIVIEGDGVVEAAFERPDLRPAAIWILRVQKIPHASDDAGAPGVAVASGRVGGDLGQETHFRPRRLVVQRADEGPEAIRRRIEVRRVLLHGFGIVGEPLTRQARNAAILIFAPSAGGRLETDDRIRDGPGVGRGVPVGRPIQRHVVVGGSDGLGRRRRSNSGGKLGRERSAVGQMLGLGACQILGPRTALRIGQGADPVAGQAHRRRVQPQDFCLSGAGDAPHKRDRAKCQHRTGGKDFHRANSHNFLVFHACLDRRPVTPDDSVTLGPWPSRVSMLQSRKRQFSALAMAPASCTSQSSRSKVKSFSGASG